LVCIFVADRPRWVGGARLLGLDLPLDGDMAAVLQKKDRGGKVVTAVTKVTLTRSDNRPPSSYFDLLPTSVLVNLPPGCYSLCANACRSAVRLHLPSLGLIWTVPHQLPAHLRPSFIAHRPKHGLKRLGRQRAPRDRYGAGTKRHRPVKWLPYAVLKGHQRMERVRDEP
jgi:hypothetical protein